MRQKGYFQDSFFGMKGFEARPISVATEFVDTDWDEEDEEDATSEIEDEDPDSPRVSLNSSGQQSVTTLSSYDEAQTPRSSRAREAYPFDFYTSAKPVEGPRGPHLFRASGTSSNFTEYQEILSLSPITPKTARPYAGDLRVPIAHEPLPQVLSQPPRSRTSPFQFTHEKLDPSNLPIWTPEKVAQWMLNAGIEMQIAGKFVENDINGAILITLKFEDLRELDIQSFGVRTKVWEEIHALRDSKAAAAAAVASPRLETPIEDSESREVRRERKKNEKMEGADGAERSRSVNPSKNVKRTHSRRKPAHEDIISPLESVSIVGIEQMMPKPHHCSKGENCAKFRRQQRMIEAFKRDHPFVDVDKGGIIMVAGDPGNPATAPAINRPSSTEALRPLSDAVPSVVASSDVLGPGMSPFQYLQEAALRNVQTRDPLDNVRQFLDFQQPDGDAEVPPTPPFEILSPPSSAAATPAPRTPHEGLRALPKLAIPGKQQPPAPQAPAYPQHYYQQPQRYSQPARPSPPPRSASATPTPAAVSHYPQRMERAEALSPDLSNAPYRFGTPFSDMDVPLTAVPLGPVARDASQSVPPDMSYRAAGAGLARSQSRSSRRPSFQVMAPVEEDATARALPKAPHVPASISPRSPPPPPGLARAPSRSHHPQPPPRVQYPWSPQQRAAFERALAPVPTPDTLAAPAGSSSSSSSSPSSSSPQRQHRGAGAAAGTPQDADGATYQGPVKKRKTRMLRHEWHEQYATLRGTRLALHRDGDAARERKRALEYIDIDDYAIACSSLSAGSKLNAAFKAMSISRAKHGHSASESGGGGGGGAGGGDVAAFSFQLIPQDHPGKSSRLRKRESQSPGSGAVAALAAGGEEFATAANGTGKTHHFAVRSRDERIDWMRELMLAKALRQKGEGFEVSVNGNMI
ncbi:hypothetical protein GGS23DRAFT_598178 [Durotheca rogersii]|uniref:uncharacterized protein n=1 Tax=Durotheca rogersii TaxID=419775 RepID=UPI00221EB3C3|nr:uncharacterized protein GGS23DRAFT_598178 [Durotheca rogersii]KAI5861772.1 hypothetical protein GGS23DRAFT_598178 [Durotheca rogersii]